MQKVRNPQTGTRPGVSVLLVLLGCQGPADTDRGAPAPPDDHAAAAPFSVSDVVRQVHFAYRPAGSGYEGGHTTYSVQVDADHLSITPYHYPRPARSLSGDPGGDGLEDPPVEAMKAAPLSLARANIELGGARLGCAGGFSVDQDGTLTTATTAACAATERLRNTEDGIEQSWTFAAPPPGEGDLLVRLRVSGLLFAGETAAGLHFADPLTGLGIRYGTATWVDATGSSTPVELRHEGSEVLLRVPAGVLARSSYPAVLDPLVGPEFGMDQPVFGPALSRQFDAAMAFTGAHYLVVWSDQRQPFNSSIIGARVLPSGKVLDRSGLLLTKAEPASSVHPVIHPALAWNGNEFLLVFERFVPRAFRTVLGLRLQGDGKVLGPGPFVISLDGPTNQEPRVASDGQGFLVVWTSMSRPGDLDISASRVSAAGAVLDPTAIAVAVLPGSQAAPDVTHTGDHYLVVWQDGRNAATSGADIFGARVSAGGKVLDPAGIPIATQPGNEVVPALAQKDGTALVVWEFDGTPNAIRGARVDAGGKVLDPAGILISAAPIVKSAPAIAAGNNFYLVAWKESSGSDPSRGGISGARVTAGGKVLDPFGSILSGVVTTVDRPQVGHGTDNFLVTWTDGRNRTADDIYGVRVGDHGGSIDVLSPDAPIALGANDQLSPHVAFDGVHYLVVWQDVRNATSYDIFGVRVDRAGRVLDPSGIAISTAPMDQTDARVAWRGKDFLVVWQDQRNTTDILRVEVFGARVSAAGAVLDPAGIPIALSATEMRFAPAVAFDGKNALVVYATQGLNLLGARVDLKGKVLDPAGFALTSGGTTDGRPVLAFGGGRYLALFTDFRTGVDQVFATRVDPSGRVLDPGGIAVSSDAAGILDVAFGGGHFLAVWSKSGAARGARIRPDGALLDPAGLSLSTTAGMQDDVALAFQGSRYLLVWSGPTSGAQVLGARVSADGALLDPQGFTIAPGPDQAFLPALAADGKGGYLVAYTSFKSTLNAHRVRARIVTP